jgi:erythritol kinase (D-erythritol 1-phosphate-forming)
MPAPDCLASTRMCDCPKLLGRCTTGWGLAACDCYIAMGGFPATVRIPGGAADSKSMRAILAACLNCPVRAATHDEAGGAAGAAMMAAVSVGLYPDMAACAAC